MLDCSFRETVFCAELSCYRPVRSRLVRLKKVEFSHFDVIVKFFSFVCRTSRRTCSLCSGNAGVCVECAHPDCGTAFHVSCSSEKELRMDLENIHIWCHAHRLCVAIPVKPSLKQVYFFLSSLSLFQFWRSNPQCVLIVLNTWRHCSSSVAT